MPLFVYIDSNKVLVDYIHLECIIVIFAQYL